MTIESTKLKGLSKLVGRRRLPGDEPSFARMVTAFGEKIQPAPKKAPAKKPKKAVPAPEHDFA